MSRLLLLFAVLATTRLALGFDYRSAMRSFIIEISKHAKARNPNFAIIPQNGIELIMVNSNDDSTGALETAYLAAIDGVGQEDLYYGYSDFNVATDATDSAYLRGFLNRIRTTKKVMVTDYCTGQAKANHSIASNHADGYISFAADQLALDDIPKYPAHPLGENANNITKLSEAKNFLYIINPQNYATTAAFIKAVSATNFDVVLMDLFDNNNAQLGAAQVAQLKKKANGGRRLVICYMSIGEAENYRYYWKSNWKVGNPTFVAAADPNWPGNYKVRYWYPAWQSIIVGNSASYTQRILNSGFDGVYLDIIDAFEYFEGK